MADLNSTAGLLLLYCPPVGLNFNKERLGGYKNHTQTIAQLKYYALRKAFPKYSTFLTEFSTQSIKILFSYLLKSLLKLSSNFHCRLQDAKIPTLVSHY